MFEAFEKEGWFRMGYRGDGEGKGREGKGREGKGREGKGNGGGSQSTGRRKGKCDAALHNPSLLLEFGYAPDVIPTQPRFDSTRPLERQDRKYIQEDPSRPLPAPSSPFRIGKSAIYLDDPPYEAPLVFPKDEVL